MKDNPEEGLLLSLYVPFHFHFAEFFEFVSQDTTRFGYNAYCLIAWKIYATIEIFSHSVNLKVNAAKVLEQNCTKLPTANAPERQPIRELNF